MLKRYLCNVMVGKVEVRVRNVPWHAEFFQHLPCSKANVIFYQEVKNKMRGLRARFQKDGREKKERNKRNFSSKDFCLFFFLFVCLFVCLNVENHFRD